jgi:transcriptional regulator with XRE-family HTH domain
MSSILDINSLAAMQLAEIGAAVRRRREALGLSQKALARLAGLSRATINQLERGGLTDLGIAKLARLLGLLGLDLGARRTARPARGLLMASRTASVSYRRALDARALAKALASGRIPPGLEPHLSFLLDEAPLQLVVRSVEEAARSEHVPPERIWRNLARWAAELESPRRVWA